MDVKLRLLKRPSLLHCVAFGPWSKISWLYLCGSVWLYSVPSISVPFTSTTWSGALYSALKWGSICLPTLSCSFNIMLAILGLSFHRKFTISVLLHKITCWNFDICCKWKVLSTPVVFFPFIYRNHFWSKYQTLPFSYQSRRFYWSDLVQQSLGLKVRPQRPLCGC